MRLALLMAWVVLLAGCGGSGSAGGGRQAVVPQQFASSGESVQASVSAPREAAYTIYCRDFTGANHAAVAEQVKKQVEQVQPRLKDLYLVRGENRTVLYHGFYATFDEAVDRREAQRAKGDRKLLEELVDARQAKIFPRTVFEPLERPDPEAPAEWDLRNVRGYWTLLVITFTDPVMAKQSAIESVREARKQGYEAYYFHKDSQSHVLIGSWPADAIKRQSSIADQKPTDYVNPETIVVDMTGDLAQKLKGARDEYGRPLRVYEMRVEILDAKLRELYGKLAFSVDGRPTREFPLLLQIPPAIGREDALESQSIEAAPNQEANPLLRRY